MPPTRYTIENSQKQAEQFRALLRRADEVGRRDEVVSAAHRLFARLVSNPSNCGEQREELRHLGLPVRIDFERPLVVCFAIHEAEKKVFIKYLRLASRRGW
jgi:hypothetical protein